MGDDANEEDEHTRWCRYYLATEDYDRSLPGRWSPYDHDVWIPLPQSMAASAAYSRKMTTALGLPRRISHEEVAVLRMGYAHWQRVVRDADARRGGDRG